MSRNNHDSVVHREDKRRKIIDDFSKHTIYWKNYTKEEVMVWNRMIALRNHIQDHWIYKLEEGVQIDQIPREMTDLPVLNSLRIASYNLKYE